MKLLTPPFAGFLEDTAQVLYVKPLGQPSNASNFALVSGSSNGRLVNAGTLPTPGQSLFDPSTNGASKAWSAGLARTMWYTSSQAFAPGAQLQSNWSIAFHYSVVSAGTQCLFSRESAATISSVGAADADRFNWRLFWTDSNQAWNFVYPSNGNGTRTVVAPNSGVLGVTRELLDTGQQRFRIFHNGDLISGPFDAVMPTGPIGTSASARFQLGNSAAAGGNYTTVSTSFGWAGSVGEVAVWAEALSPAKMRSLHGQSVKTYDDYDLWLSGGQRTRYKVLVESSASGSWTDLSNHDGADWVQSVKVSRAVSEDSKISLSLRRYRGRYANISPLDTEADYAGILKLRRRVVVLRAITPRMMEPRESDFRYCASGFIETWDTKQDVVSVEVSDDGAPMRDDFALDPRSYTFASGKSAEEHQQQIIDDYEPKIRSTATTYRIGYKGGRPIVMSPQGSPHTPTLNRKGQTLRYNDVGTGNVAGALQAVSDQIGAECRFMPRDDMQESWLLSYTPRREKLLPYNTLIGSSGQDFVDVTCLEPHGLSIGSGVSLAGTASSNFIGTVASVNSWFSFRASVASGYSPSSAAGLTTGTLAYDFNLALRAEDLFDIDPIKAEAASIRNHAVVRYQRNETTTTGFGSVTKVASGAAAVTLGERLPNIDPEDLGITFTITGGTTPFNANYTGKITGDRTVTSNETVPTLIVGTTSVSITFSTQNQAYREEVSTATSSMNEYGFMPAAMFEGSNLGINTQAEASRLATAFTSDLSEPT